MKILELLQSRARKAFALVGVRSTIAIVTIIITLSVLITTSYDHLNPFSGDIGPLSIPVGAAFGLFLCGLGLLVFKRSKKALTFIGILLVILGFVQVVLSFDFLFPELGIPTSYITVFWTEVFTALIFIFVGTLFMTSDVRFLRHVHFSEIMMTFIVMLSIFTIIESSSVGFMSHVDHLPLFYVKSPIVVWFFLGICIALFHALQSSENLKLKNWVVITLFSLVLLSITIVSVLFVEQVFNDQVEASFREEVSNTTDLIEARFAIYENTLEGVSGLFAASDTIKREQWKQYVDSLDIQNNYPGIQGVGYSIFVSPQQREEHIASIKNQGFPQYDIKPEGQRDIYSSIIYLEPFDDQNSQSLGFDMFHEKTRRAAMEFARDSGSPALSGPVALTRKSNDESQAGFMVYVPHYSTLSPESLQQRRETIIGFVYSPFQARDFIEGAIGAKGLTDISLSIYDGSTDQEKNELYDDTDLKGFTQGQPRFSLVEEIEIKGRKWQLAYNSSPQYGISITSKLVPLLLFISSVIFSLLLSVAIYALVHSKQRAQDIAKTMTESFRLQQRRLDSFHTIATMPQIDLPERIKKTLETVRQGLDLESGIVSNISNSNYTISHIDSLDDQIKQGQNFDISQTLCAAAYVQDRPIYYHSKDGDLVSQKDIAPQLRASTYIGVPISTNGQRYGTVCFFGKSHRAEFTEDDRTFVVLAANWIARLIENNQIDTAKNEFLTLASHQLRTPLSIINWYSELLQNKKFGELNEKQQKYLGEIRTGNHRVIKLVNELLNASRLDMGSFMVEPVEISLEKTLTEVHNQYATTIKEKNITYIQEIESKAQMIICDQSIIDLVLDNLFSNAVKYTPKGGKMKCLVRSQGNDHISIDVLDSGMGIPEEEEKRIFSKMYRATNVKEKDTDGTGLGLYMVKKALNAIEGTIQFSSTQDVGTTFTVTIPRESKKRDGTSRLVSHDSKK